METAITVLVGLWILFEIIYAIGWAFRSDLDEMEKTNPKYRKYLKDKYGW